MPSWEDGENAQKAAPEAGQGRDTDSLHNQGEGSQARQTGPTNTSSKDTLAGEGSGATSGGDSSAYAQPAQVGTSAENAHSLRRQFYDLIEIFRIGGFAPDTNYLFLGGFRLIRQISGLLASAKP